MISHARFFIYSLEWADAHSDLHTWWRSLPGGIQLATIKPYYLNSKVIIIQHKRPAFPFLYTRQGVSQMPIISIPQAELEFLRNGFTFLQNSCNQEEVRWGFAASLNVKL